MKVVIKDLNYFLSTCIKPVVAFTMRNALVEPVITITAKKKQLIISCIGNDRKTNVYPGVTVKEEGKCSVTAASISAIKSSHKKAILTIEKKKLIIKSGGGSRKLLLSIDTIEKISTLSIKAEKNSKEVGVADLNLLHDIFTEAEFAPILTPSNPKAIVCIQEKKGLLTVYINDSFRISKFVQKKSKMKLKTDLVTDYVELSTIIKMVSGMSDNAAFSFTKKYISVTGFEEDTDKPLIEIVLNHSLPNTDQIERVHIVTKRISAEKPVIAIRVTEDFKEILSNILTIANMRNQKGHVDIKVKGTNVTMIGSGPNITQKEKIKISKKQINGKGTVRINAVMLSDIVKFMKTDISVFKVTGSSIVLETPLKEKASSTFFLPHQSLDKK